MLRPGEGVIDESNWQEFAIDGEVDGQRKARGCVPRNLRAHPLGSLPGVRRFDMPLLPWPEIRSRLIDLAAAKANNSDIRLNNGSPIFSSLDQNGEGFCWAYSSTVSVMYLRAKANLPPVRLSAHAVACKINNFRDEGGWSAKSASFIYKNGVPSVAAWPEKSMQRRYDNEATWKDAANYKFTEGWWDFDVAAYDAKLTAQQFLTSLALGIGATGDLYWMGHSMFAAEAFVIDESAKANDVEAYAIRYQNSWTDRDGVQGLRVIKGRRGIPDGGVAPRVVEAWEGR